MKQRSRYAWVVPTIRYGLLVVAVVYLVLNVPWYDYVTLTDPEQRVRLVGEEWEDDALVSVRVQVDAEEREYAAERVEYNKDGTLPNIQYGLATTLQQIRVAYLVYALLIFIPVPFLQSARLVFMLAIQDVRISLWTAIKLSFAGNFYNFALPGTVGGDVVKAWYLTDHTHRKTEAIITIFLDRVVGLVGNVLIASGALLIAVFMSVGGLGQFVLVPIVVGIGCIVGATLAWSPFWQRRLRLRQLAERLPLSQHTIRVGAAIGTTRRHPGRLLIALGLTIMLQFFAYFSAFVMAKALWMDGGLVRYMIFIPLGMMIAAIPLSPQGFGLMEWAFIQFFTGPGLANSVSQAVMLALLLRITQLVWALPGGLVPLLGAHAPRPAELAELEESVEEALEHAAEEQGAVPAPAANTPPGGGA